MNKFNKLWASLLPLATMAGGFLGFEVTPEWWSAVAVAATPILVYYLPNKE